MQPRDLRQRHPEFLWSAPWGMHSDIRSAPSPAFPKSSKAFRDRDWDWERNPSTASTPPARLPSSTTSSLADNSSQNCNIYVTRRRATPGEAPELDATAATVTSSPGPDDAVSQSRTLPIVEPGSMTNRPEGWKGPESLHAPGSGFHALGKRSVAFKDSRELENIRQSAGTKEENPRASFEDIPNRDLEGDLADLRADDGLGQEGRSVESDKMDAQRQLNQYRERLAKDIGKREVSARVGGHAPTPGVAPTTRVSPIEEEKSASSPPSVEPTTTSTESGATVRGGSTPGWTVRTPSYPFPRMTTPGMVPSSLHRPFTALSPTMAPASSMGAFDSLRGQDSVLSNLSTPASNRTMTFLPQGYKAQDNLGDFPSPNLYELTLMLSAEPGLDAWWNTVVQIMTEVYRAERVTLAVPADSTDIENVPWGQKATFSANREDDFSMGYMARGSSVIPNSTDEFSETPSQVGGSEPKELPVRPAAQSRHSFTAYEDRQEESRGWSGGESAGLRRPNPLLRSMSSYPAPPPEFSSQGNKENDPQTELSRQTLEEHDAMEDHQSLGIPSWEDPYPAHSQGKGKVLNVLQALDYEADPLIDHNGVLRVLERGKVIALTRNYPYLNQATAESKHSELRSTTNAKSPEASRRRLRKPRSDSTTSKLSALLGNAKLPQSSTRPGKGHSQERKATMTYDDDEPQPPSPKYEEYEQAPPSPWSQSPAPSPAVRSDPAENPFFTDAMVDEESFNPSPGMKDYSTIGPQEAIGVDNSCWTVLHIPLTHVLLSKPNPAFRLDATILEQKSGARGKGTQPRDYPTPLQPSPDPTIKEKHAPIAILSILSPIIPYPSNLRHSLEHLAPHLATTYSLCRHYTNLEMEVSGLQKRRPGTSGFGALGPDGRPLIDTSGMGSFAYLPVEEILSRGSLAGSITSPSDYSGPSRSAAGSPTGTPLWDPAGLGSVNEKRTSGSSPATVMGDSYFSTKPRPPSKEEQRSRRNSRDSPNADRRSSLRLPSGKARTTDSYTLISPSGPGPESSSSGDLGARTSDESPTSYVQQKRVIPKEHQESRLNVKEDQEEVGSSTSWTIDPSKRAATGSSTHPHRHTQLHTFGADFVSTFGSLPPSSTIGKGVPHPQVPSRTNSVTQTEMTPPSDRLKGLILDSLPAHVFVALPQTGEIVWVNSRFLAYRGQTSSDLAADPWGSIHPDDRDEYLRRWSHCVRSGEQFSRTVRIRRFDGQFRWFYARAVASKDKRGVILQFLGSYMDIHDQHIAELKAARQKEVEASEAKHRLLANLIPQIIFTATEGEGVTFANEQWLSYTGQNFEDSLGVGFMDFVHPGDLAKCRIPNDRPPTPLMQPGTKGSQDPSSPSDKKAKTPEKAPATLDTDTLRAPRPLSRHNSSSSSSVGDLPTANLSELARKGVIKVTTDSNGRLSYTTEIRLRSKTGEYRWHLIRCVEIDNINFGNGESSYFGSATDINDLKLLETKLKEAMESKSRFLSNMSHEIRTPLIGISGMVSFLQDTTLNEEQRDYTNTIQTSANSLLMIINDILDLSKVDAGMMKLSYEWFHTRSLIEDVNELVSTMAIAKRLELNYMVEEAVPAWIKGDRVRIRQVLLNVIGNAIKFTSSGEVFSRCGVVAPKDANLSGDEIMLEFSIIDTGRGFTKEEAEMIFKPFSQIDGSSTRQHGGSGLGLVISRQLVELHGGKMEGTAVPGQGSTFTFTAKFGLPSESDKPDSSLSPRPSPKPIQILPQVVPRTKPLIGLTPTVSPTGTDPDFISPALASSSSSEPSVTSSARTQLTGRSSMSSVNVGLVRFSEAARASGQDLSQMKLEMPSPEDKQLSDATPTPSLEEQQRNLAAAEEFRPPMYSILVICPQTHSREATTQHIEMTLPKDIPHQITALSSVDEARQLIGGEDPVIFTHVVVNLPTPEEIVGLTDEIMRSTMVGKATILILSDSVQRQALMKQVAGTKYEDVLSDGADPSGRRSVTYIYKPVKPSRFAVIFDPAKLNDLSIDRNRSTAQRLVETQRRSYLEVEKRMGNKGYKVLLVEDNPVNQKVLQKYLRKVGVEVELAADGVECTEKVFAHPHDHYSLILCDLHMPRKDGYQACREVRAWEAEGGFPRMPIIALSANVMSDVQDKCVEAGFSDYVTKPVDFIDLSNALAKFF